MKTPIKIKIKKKFADEIRKGYPLISKDAILNSGDLQEEGAIISLYDESNKFIGKGYYGKQNKGYGWVLSRNEKEPIDESFFVAKLYEAISHREKLFHSKETNAFRVFNGEGDGIGGVTIDFFDGYYVINWYSEGIYTFKKELVLALQQLPDCKGIYQKKRFDVQGKYIEDNDYVWGEEPTFPLIVKENGVNFAIYLNEGAMVGVFLDQRDVRNKIKNNYAKGKNVLNTFSYTGAFSIFAALGNAEKTTSVDLANRSLSKTREQFQINGIDYNEHSIIVEDVFKYFKYAVKKELKFDMVILDPPSFARSKNITFSASKDYTKLLKEAIAITEKEGIVVASTNCSSFNMKKFKTFVDTAFRESGSRYKIIEEFSLPDDFKTIKEYKEGDYLKVLFVKKLS